LGGKLACFLIQLPPKYDYTPENLEAFFGLLDPIFKYAVEFRNLSWMREETWALLEKYGVLTRLLTNPCCRAKVHLTADFAYFRWHGRGEKIWFDYPYSKEELEPWVPKVQDAASKVKKVYGSSTITITATLRRIAYSSWSGWVCFPRNRRRRRIRVR